MFRRCALYNPNMEACNDLFVFTSFLLLLLVSSKKTWAFLLPSNQIVIQRKFCIEQQTTRNNNGCCCDDDDDVVIDDTRRRSFLLAKNVPAALALSTIIPTNPACSDDGETPITTTNAEDRSDEQSSWTTPLEWIPSLNAYVLYFYLYGERFGAVVDTGSPFLTVPSYCDARRWGCFRPEKTLESGYSDTIEIFANNQGPVVWRKAGFSFSKSSDGATPVVFGVLDEALMDGSGGVFFGLIKNTAPRIRPSLLGQLENIKAFRICLNSNNNNTEKTTAASSSSGTNPRSSFLTLYTKSMITGNYIPLVTDLNRRYRDPVQHYAAVCSSIRIDGRELEPKKFRRTYVIFDTGVTGMVVSEALFEERYAAARRNKEKRLWGGSVELAFETNTPGETITLQATKPVTTPLSQNPWGRGFRANLIVMGLAFLEGHTVTVDIDDRKLQIT